MRNAMNKNRPVSSSPNAFERPFLVFLICMVSIFLSESFVMFFLTFLPPLSTTTEAFLDAAALTVMITPLLYFFVYRPIRLHVDELRRTKEEVQLNERRFRDIADNALEWIWEVDAEGKYTYASPVVEKILGFKPDEVIGKHFYDFFLPEERETLKTAALEAFRTKEPFREFINRNIHKNGYVIWLSTSGVPIVDETGNLLGFRGSDADITERRQAEEKIKRAEKEWKETFNTIPDLILVTDNRHRIVNVNKAMAEKLGLTREELMGRFCYEVIHGTEAPPPDCPHSQTISGGRPHSRVLY